MATGWYHAGKDGADARPWDRVIEDGSPDPTIGTAFQRKVGEFYAGKVDCAKLAAHAMAPLRRAVAQAEEAFALVLDGYRRKVQLRHQLQGCYEAVGAVRRRLGEVETAGAMLARRVAAVGAAGVEMGAGAGGSEGNTQLPPPPPELACLLAELRARAVSVEPWYTCEPDPPYWLLSPSLAELPCWQDVAGDRTPYRLADLNDATTAGNFVAERLLCSVRSLFEATSAPPGVGGGGGVAGAGYELTRVQLIDNRPSTTRFSVHLEGTLMRRTGRAGGGFWDQPAVDDGEKPAWLDRLKGAFLPSGIGRAPRVGGSGKANIVLAWHGTSEDEADPGRSVVHSICQLGLADLASREDRGFFGRGCYTTLQAWYAAMYATGALASDAAPRPPNGDGEYVMLLCAVAVGNAYVVSRATDYRRPDGSGCEFNKFDFRYPDGVGDTGKDLEVGFDAHFAPISTESGFQLPQAHGQPDADELVVKSDAQVLPLCKVYFKRRSGAQ
jgi:hypothetical protein